MSETPEPGQDMSRRGFLKFAGRAFAGGAGAYVGAKLYGDHQPTFDKVGQSVRDGKILEEVQQVLESQVAKDEKATITEKCDYDDGWLEGLFDSKYFYKTDQSERGRIAFLEVTNKGKILETQDVGSDLSTAFGNEQPRFMTLPYPQHNEHNRYLMHAEFNFKGEKQVVSDNPRSPVRGGIVFENGIIRAGYPGDFKDDNSTITPFERVNVDHPNTAQIEYFFVMDSTDIEGGLSSLADVPSAAGKNFRNTQEFSSAIVTFYSSKNNEPRTFAMSSFRDIDTQNGAFEPQFVEDFTIPQLVSLAEDFRSKEMTSSDRFIIAFADPGPNQYLAESTSTDYSELYNENLDPFIARDIPKETLSNEPLHRVFGGNSSSSSVYRPVKALKPAYLVVSS